MIQTKNHSIERICKQCGAKCCKPSMVVEPFDINLGPGDFTRILELGASSLISTVFDSDEGLRFILRPHIFGYCPFLDYQTSKCKIYSFRPSICKRFPYDPQIDSLVKKQCLLFNSLEQRRISVIEKRYVNKFRSKTFYDKQKKLDKLDAINYSDRYVIMIDDQLKRKNNCELVNNSSGSFVIESYVEGDVRILEPILDLLEAYKERFSLKQIIIDIFVIDRLYNLISGLTGVLGAEHLTQSEIHLKLSDQSNYYGTKFDGSFLTGVFYIEDLKRDSTFWNQCWDELISVLRRN